MLLAFCLLEVMFGVNIYGLESFRGVRNSCFRSQTTFGTTFRLVQLRIFVLGGTKPSRKVSGSRYAMGVLKTVIEYGLESFRGVNIYGLESFRGV